jgi:hypothetical protein
MTSHQPALLQHLQARWYHCCCQEHCKACHVKAQVPALPVLLLQLQQLPCCQAWRGACCSWLLLLLLPA